MRASPVWDAAGAVVGVSTVESPIVAGDLSGSFVVDAGAYLRSAFEDAPNGIALTAIEGASRGRLLRVNRALCELTGYPPAALEAMGIEALVHPDDLDPDRAATARLAAGETAGFQLEQRWIHADRHAIWVIASGSLVPAFDGRPAYCIRQLQDIEERKRFEGELGYLADHDPLTGALNRRGFVQELTAQIAHARRYGGGGAVLLFDIDDFKLVNDTLGHSVGDRVISEVALAASARLRETDVFARLGGDEFAVLLPHATESDACALAESLLESVRDANTSIELGHRPAITVSIGVSVFHEPGEELTADEILIESDLAMYAAKEAGKDRIALADPAARKQQRSKITWAQRIRHAVHEYEFQLYCQPITDLRTDRISQWELLLRLPAERGELILPSRFLYTAERSGLIVEIDRWVLSEAIRLIAEHHDAGHALRLEVNISGRSIADAELPGFVEQQLAASAVDPASLVLELTETATIANMGQARKFATRVTEIGCGFALDDFGAGFGSFYYLKYLPFDYIKIDGEFIRHLPASSTDQLILDSIVHMANGLGKRTVAEYVGDHDTVELLKAHGVDYGQGYHLGRPRPVTDLRQAD